MDVELKALSYTRGLAGILLKLKKLHVDSVLDSEAVEDVISECNAKIDEYLKDYQASSLSFSSLSSKLDLIIRPSRSWT